MELSQRITKLTEDLEKLRSEKAMLLQSLDYAEDTKTDTIRKDNSAMEATLDKVSRQEQKYAAELDNALKEYASLDEQASEFDADELMAERLAIRPEKEQATVARVESAYGDRYQPDVMSDAKRNVAKMLGEETERKSVREQLKKIQHEKETPRPKKKKRDEWER